MRSGKQPVSVLVFGLAAWLGASPRAAAHLGFGDSHLATVASLLFMLGLAGGFIYLIAALLRGAPPDEEVDDESDPP